MTPRAANARWPKRRDQITTQPTPSDQTGLFEGNNAPPLQPPSKLEQGFLEFDLANPAVFAAFKRIAVSLLEGGRKRYGARAILERVRWDASLTTVSDEFKLNNNYVALYARKLIAEDPRFSDFFRLKGPKGRGAQS